MAYIVRSEILDDMLFENLDDANLFIKLLLDSMGLYIHRHFYFHSYEYFKRLANDEDAPMLDWLNNNVSKWEDVNFLLKEIGPEKFNISIKKANLHPNV